MNETTLRKARMGRIRRVREEMSKDRISAFLFTDLANIFYLSGFRGSDGALVLTTSDVWLLVDGRYGAQAKMQAPHCHPIVYPAKLTGIAQILRKFKARRVGFEPKALSVEFYGSLQEELPRISWITPSGWIASLRAIKDPYEILLLQSANRTADRSFRVVMKGIREGRQERVIAAELETLMRKNGAEGASFPTIVAGGRNAALPHASAEKRRVRNGEPILIDFGGSFHGYQTDQTVTLFLARVPARWKEIYSVVKEAHDLAIAGVKPGMRACDIDGIARTHIDKRGYGRCFSHSLGHGVGVEVHEYPSISATSDAALKPGMVFTIEPGIYLPGEGGVRIEDTIHLGWEGVKRLTSVDKVLRAR